MRERERERYDKSSWAIFRPLFQPPPCYYQHVNLKDINKMIMSYGHFMISVSLMLSVFLSFSFIIILGWGWGWW